jgi:hypothetical protein
VEHSLGHLKSTPAELVKLHWSSRNLLHGPTEILSSDLDKQGAFANWPGFFDEVAPETRPPGSVSDE